MRPDKARISDGVTAKLGSVKQKRLHVPSRLRPRRLTRAEQVLYNRARVRGLVEVRLFGPNGALKHAEAGYNLVTDYGDEHIATRIFDDAQDIVTGMRLGTGSTAAAKSGAGAAIGTYISGSNEALDSAATASDLGGGSGHRAIHVCTWVAGDVTNSAIAEVALTDETPLTDVAGAAGNTVARFVFGSTIDKQSGDSLEVTWNLDVLGA